MLLKKFLIFSSFIIINLLGFYIQYIFPHFSTIIIPLDLSIKIIYIFLIIFYKIKNKIFKKEIEIDNYVNKNIAITITCYTESTKEIFNTIDSLVDNIKNTELNSKIFIIYDGLSKEKNTENYTFDNVIDKMTIISKKENIKYNENWKKKDILINIVETTYNNITIYHIIKQTNLGKTDSLTFVRDLLSNRLSNDLTNNFKNIKDFYYCASMDADCIMNEDGLIKLYNQIIQKDIIGVSGAVYPKEDDKKRFWYFYQFSEYYTSQYLTRKAHTYLGCVNCLPGAFNIIDLNYYNDEIRNDFLQHPDKSSLFRSIAVLVGEDKRFTSLLLYFNKGKKTIIDDNVKIYTTVPNSLRKMISQRRRWVLSALVNLYYDMVGPNIHFLIRLECLCNIISFLFYIFIYVYIYYLFFIFLTNESFNVINFETSIVFYSMISVILIYKFSILCNINKIKFKLIYFIGELLMLLFNPFFKILILIKCIITMDNFNWGNVKQNELEEKPIDIVIHEPGPLPVNSQITDIV